MAQTILAFPADRPAIRPQRPARSAPASPEEARVLTRFLLVFRQAPRTAESSLRALEDAIADVPNTKGGA